MNKKYLIIGSISLAVILIAIGSVLIYQIATLKRGIKHRQSLAYNQRSSLPEIIEHRKAFDEFLTEEEKNTLREIRENHVKEGNGRYGRGYRDGSWGERGYRKFKRGDTTLNRYPYNEESIELLLSIMQNHELELDSVLHETNINKFNYSKRGRFIQREKFHKRGRGHRRFEGRTGRSNGRYQGGFGTNGRGFKPMGPIEFLLVNPE